jgi:hypothetical protein
MYETDAGMTERTRKKQKYAWERQMPTASASLLKGEAGSAVASCASHLSHF